MVVFELAVLLALTSIAAFPCWRYSVDWGYLPSTLAGVMLLVVMVVAVTDKAPDRMARHGAVGPTVRVAAAPTTDADRRHHAEIVQLASPMSQ